MLILLIFDFGGDFRVHPRDEVLKQAALKNVSKEAAILKLIESSWFDFCEVVFGEVPGGELFVVD